MQIKKLSIGSEDRREPEGIPHMGLYHAGAGQSSEVEEPDLAVEMAEDRKSATAGYDLRRDPRTWAGGKFPPGLTVNRRADLDPADGCGAGRAQRCAVGR